MIRVLICDDHQIVRQGIKQMLSDASDIALAGEADCGPEALRQVRAPSIDTSTDFSPAPLSKAMPRSSTPCPAGSVLPAFTLVRKLRTGRVEIGRVRSAAVPGATHRQSLSGRR